VSSFLAFIICQFFLGYLSILNQLKNLFCEVNMTKTKTDVIKFNITKAKTNKFQQQTVCNAHTLKPCLKNSSVIITKFCTFIDLTDDLLTKEYVTNVSTVIEIIDLTN
jgi:hypothetical protein